MNIKEDLKHFSVNMLKDELQTILILKTIVKNHLYNIVVKNELGNILNSYKNIITLELEKRLNNDKYN